MKKLFLSFICIGLILTISSCKEEVNQDSISAEEATEMVAMALSEDAMGAIGLVYSTVEVSSNAGDVPQKAKTATIVSKDTTITYSSFPKALITYSLVAGFSYDFTLGNNGTPTSSVVEYSYNGNFDAPRLSSVHTGSGKLSISSLDSEICTVNGTFMRSSDIETKGLNPKQSDSETSLIFNNIKVNKMNHVIASGSATATISGTLANKGDFEYSGTVIFEGNGMATLTFGNQSFSVNLETGEYVTL